MVAVSAASSNSSTLHSCGVPTCSASRAARSPAAMSPPPPPPRMAPPQMAARTSSLVRLRFMDSIPVCVMKGKKENYLRRLFTAPEKKL
ncbi:hypothetical protein D9M68_537730 [compost metagenome]